MLFHRRIEARHFWARTLFAAALGLTSAAGFADPASAQSFFDMLFGGARRPAAHQQLPPQASAYTDAYGTPAPHGDQLASSGRSVAFCVRLCDGRYFPVQRHHAATPVQLCSAFCPASKTKVFYGGDIERASGPGGERYADLDNAFVYRKKLVNDCTCNGRDAFGLARLDASSDPTLQTGDVVATRAGLMVYAGGRQRRGTAQAGEFTPVRNISGPSAEPRPRVAAGNSAVANRAAD